MDMNFKFTVKHFELTPSIKSFAEKKLERIAQKTDKGSTISVTLETSKNRQKAEVMVYVHGSLLKVETADDVLYVAIDKLADKLNFQVSKRIGKSKKKSQATIRFLEDNIHFSEENTEGVDEETMGEKSPIVKRKYFDMKPMMEEEALLQMQLLGHAFFFFFNGETDTMCLLYKRNDGNYGLIEGVH